MRLSFPDTVRETKGAASKNRGRPEWIEIELEGRRLFLPSALLVKKLKREREGNLPIGREIVDRDTPLPLDYQPDDLIRIDRRWNFHGPDAPKHLRTEAARMLEVMLENARSRGIELRVLSAFRSSHRQRFLYLRETRRLGWDQRWTAKPGHSEHQLGTAVDLCTPDPVSVLNPDFDRTREGLWLEHHAGRFGFRRSYRQENQARTGYHPEPWHYRYFGFR